MKRILLLLSLCITIGSFAQNFEWATSGGLVSGPPSSNIVQSVVRDSQGNIYHITESGQDVHCQGTVVESIGGSTTFIHKFNADGELQWIRRIGTNFYALNLALDDENNLYVLGNLYGTYNLQFEDQTLAASAQYRNFLFKINPEGEYQWHIMTDTSGSYGACPLLLYANDHIYTQTGHTTISKLDMAGEVQATLTPDAFANYNAQNQIFFSDAEAMANGDVVFHGCAYATITYGTSVLVPETDSGNVPNIAVRTDAFLEVQWAKMYNGLNTSGKKLSSDNAGNLYYGVRVNTSFTAGSDTVENTAPGSTNYIDAILKTDGNGDPLWIKAISTQARIDALVADPDGSGVLFGGFISNNISIGDFPLVYSDGRAYIAKISPDGTFMTACNFTKGSFGANNHIIPATDGRFIAAGHLAGGIGEMGCMEVTDTDGFYLTQFTLDPINAPIPTIVANGSTLTAEPEFSGNIQWFLGGEPIPGANGQTLEINQAGTYSVSYGYDLGCEDSVSVPSLSSGEFLSDAFAVYPNPSSATFHVKLPTGNYNYVVSDVNGRTIVSGKASADFSLDLSTITDGVYLLRLTSENASVVKKLIKQNQ